MLPYIVAGLTTGSIFALAGVGLVLTYKTSGIFNFAHGALASVAAFLFYFLHSLHGVAWPLAALIAIVLAGPVMGLVIDRLTRSLGGLPLTMRVLATVGLLLAIEGALELLFPPGPDRQVVQFLPTHAFDVAGTQIGVFRIVIAAVALAAVVSLTALVRYSRIGLSMRAVVDNAELLDVTGISPAHVRRFSWMLGSTTAAIAGVLLAPLLPLDATTLTFLVVTAFGATAIGGFSSLPLTYLGGLGIGVGQALLQKLFVTSTSLTAGLAPSLPFLILFVLLLVAPRLRRPSALGNLRQRHVDTWRAPRRIQLIGGIVMAAILLAVPAFAGSRMPDWTSFLAYTLLFLSLGLLVRTSGQVSLAHVSFMAIGVAAFSHLAVDQHWPWALALLAAGLVAAPIGALLSIPAIRFPGLYLALATLGFGLLLQQMFYSQSYMFTPFATGIDIPRPSTSWLASDTGYYYLVLAITGGVALTVLGITRGRLGRLLGAMSDSADGLRSMGASINITRVLVFCLSASLAAVAGVLDAGSVGIVSSSGYQPLLSLQLFALILIVGGGAPWYAIAAAAAQVLVPAYISTSATVGYVLTLIFGLGAMYYTIIPESKRGMPTWARAAVDRLGGVDGQADPPSPAPAQPRSPVPANALATRPSDSVNGGLELDRVSVRYGGLLAADEVSLSAPAGKITALIGPNGAGKTTLFNACSGVVRPSSGSVVLGGRRIDRFGPPARARHGLGRTFQQMELFDSLTVAENVSLGREAGYAGLDPIGHVLSRRSQRLDVAARTAEALEVCHLTGLAHLTVGSLSTGQRRLVELARCMAGGFSLWLLDEPSSGLDRGETKQFGDILLSIVSAGDVGVLLIEHDLELIDQVSDYVHVVDFGRHIFDGTPADTMASPVVRAAYLGDDPGAAETKAENPGRVSA